MTQAELRTAIARFLHDDASPYNKWEGQPRNRQVYYLDIAVRMMDAVPAINLVPDMIEALLAVQTASTSPALPDGDGNDMAVQSALVLVDRVLAKLGDGR